MPYYQVKDALFLFRFGFKTVVQNGVNKRRLDLRRTRTTLIQGEEVPHPPQQLQCPILSHNQDLVLESPLMQTPSLLLGKLTISNNIDLKLKFWLIFAKISCSVDIIYNTMFAYGRPNIETKDVPVTFYLLLLRELLYLNRFFYIFT